MHPPFPFRLRVVSTPLGRFVDVVLDESDDSGDAAGESFVDAEFAILDEELSAAHPSPVVARVRALAARLRSAPDPRREALLAEIAQVRNEQRAVVAAALAAWEASLPRQVERGISQLEPPSVSSSHEA